MRLNHPGDCSTLEHPNVALAADIVHPSQDDPLKQARAARRRLADDDLKCFDRKWAEHDDYNDEPEESTIAEKAEEEAGAGAGAGTGAEAGAEMGTGVVNSEEDVGPKPEPQPRAELTVKDTVEVAAEHVTADEGLEKEKVEGKPTEQVVEKEFEEEADERAPEKAEEKVLELSVEEDESVLPETTAIPASASRSVSVPILGKEATVRLRSTLLLRSSGVVASFAAGFASFFACHRLLLFRRRRRQGLLSYSAA